MLKGNKNIYFFPSNSADSVNFHISYMIADNKKYSVIWDNDSEGIKSYNKAKASFGEEEAKKWILLPLNEAKKTTVEHLISKDDKQMLKSELNKPSTFKKLVTLLYHSNGREKIIEKLSQETKDNFDRVYNLLENVLK